MPSPATRRTASATSTNGTLRRTPCRSQKDCAKLWLKFLRNKKHFPAGGVAALESRAPAFADFQAWVGKAQ